MISYGDHSMFGESLTVHYLAWVVELYYYVSRRDEVSVEAALLQLKGIEPSEFSTQEEAEEAAKEFLAGGNSTGAIGFAAKQIHVMKISRPTRGNR